MDTFKNGLLILFLLIPLATALNLGSQSFPVLSTQTINLDINATLEVENKVNLPERTLSALHKLEEKAKLLFTVDTKKKIRLKPAINPKRIYPENTTNITMIMKINKTTVIVESRSTQNSLKTKIPIELPKEKAQSRDSIVGNRTKTTINIPSIIEN